MGCCRSGGITLRAPALGIPLPQKGCLAGRLSRLGWRLPLQGQAIRLDDFSPDVTLPFRAHAAHDGKVSDPVRVETGPAGDFVAESQALGFTP